MECNYRLITQTYAQIITSVKSIIKFEIQQLGSGRKSEYFAEIPASGLRIPKFIRKLIRTATSFDFDSNSIWFQEILC